MKKSSFVAMVLGTASGLLFAVGMCMVLVAQWQAFGPGVILGCAGLLLGLVTLLVWRRMAHKAPLSLSGKSVLTVVFGLLGTLGLGVGMCFSMVWGKLIMGIVIGLAGIIVLLGLIPFKKGLKE